MQRPEWVSPSAWGRLEAALSGQPAHAADALADLGAVVSRWDETTRERFLASFVVLAEQGLPLPAAFISSVSRLGEGDD